MSSPFCAIAFAVAALFFAAPAAAESGGEVSIFEQLSGVWVSDGDVFGAPGASTMKWTATLGDKFYRLDYRMEWRPEGKSVGVFEGVAFYRETEPDTFSAFWADNSGDLLKVAATRDGDALKAEWGIDGGERGRTRYALLPSGEVEVTDWVKTEDGWRQFNQNTYQRDEETP